MSTVSRALTKPYHQLTATENNKKPEYCRNTMQSLVYKSQSQSHLNRLTSIHIFPPGPRPWSPPGFDPVADPVHRYNHLIGLEKLELVSSHWALSTSGYILRVALWFVAWGLPYEPLVRPGHVKRALILEKGWLELVIGYFLRFPD